MVREDDGETVSAAVPSPSAATAVGVATVGAESAGPARTGVTTVGVATHGAGRGGAARAGAATVARAGRATDRPDVALDEVLARWPFWQANAFRWPVRRAWVDPDEAAALVEIGDAALLVGLGDPAALARVLSGAKEFPAAPGHTMLTRGTWDRVAAPARERLGLTPTRGWDWLMCAEPPPEQPGEDRVRLMEGTDRLERVYRVLEQGYPERGERRDDAEKHWWGYRELAGGAGATGGGRSARAGGAAHVGGVAGGNGELAGVGAAMVPEPGNTGAVHLSSVAVLPGMRRRGVGAAITARLTRWGLDRGPYVHLGMWPDNDDARRVYERLGYAVAHEVENLAPTPSS